MAVSKQDRTYARTATDLERKYNFGKSFGEVYGLIDEAKRIAKEAEGAVNNLDNDLDQEEIFNRLTNNGQAQGIYRTEDGDIYINGKYVEFLGATIGGWEITDGALKKDVTAADGTIYRVFLQPTHENYPSGTWILSCQKSTDGGKKFNGTFVLYSDGSAKFGNTKINSDGSAQFGTTTSISSDGEVRIETDAGYIILNRQGIYFYDSNDNPLMYMYSHEGEGYIGADNIRATYYNGYEGYTGTLTLADTSGNPVLLRFNKGMLTSYENY